MRPRKLSRGSCEPNAGDAAVARMEYHIGTCLQASRQRGNGTYIRRIILLPPPLFLLQPIIPHPFLHSLYEQLHLDSDPLDIFSRISIAFAQRLENSHRTFVGLGMFYFPPSLSFSLIWRTLL